VVGSVLGLFNEKSLQQFRDKIINCFPTPVGVKIEKMKRILIKDFPEGWEHTSFRQLGNTEGNFPLRDFINAVNVVNVLLADAINTD